MKLMMSEDLGGTPRTSPVAVRAKSPDAGTSGAASACVVTAGDLRGGGLSDDELVPEHLRARERDDGPVHVAAVVFGPGVERERPSDPYLPSRFVDVAVQGQERLVLLDDLA